MKVDESNFDLFQRVAKATGADYDIKWFDAENIDGYIHEDNILAMLEDLLYELDSAKEIIEDIKNDVEENYQPIPFNPYEEYGISEDNFH